MQDEYREVFTDVLIIGSGGAALRAALEADDNGAEILIVIKGEFRKSGATFHSVAEVGAYNVPDGAGDAADNPAVFLDDILRAGQGMSDPRLSKILADEAEQSLRYLEQFGVHFEREDDHYLVFRACFSSRPRSHVIHDHFKPVLKALGSEASRRGVKVMDQMMVVNLIVRDGQCHGVHAIDADGKPVVIRAKSTIVTTGGASQLFAKNLYPSDITGDGYAMAHRAGAWLTNMEFMQAGVSIVSPFVNLFGNYLWDAHPNLTDVHGQPFVEDYLPGGVSLREVIQQKERHFPFSASDISRYIEISIQRAINDGRGTPEGGVYMDFKDTDFATLLADKSRSIARMWPLTYDWYKQKGVDLYHDKVQIACSAHAINGGLYIDEDGQSNLHGLYAAGEVAAGPHGADRLGGNMALTCQVFGRRAGLAAATRAKGSAHAVIDDVFGEQDRFLRAYRRVGQQQLPALRSRLQAAANRHLLVIRSEAGLHTFLDECRQLQQLLMNDTSIASGRELVSAIELHNLIEVGQMMAGAALARTESRGGHYREDYPERDEQLEYNIVLDVAQPSGYEAVRLADLRN